MTDVAQSLLKVLETLRSDPDPSEQVIGAISEIERVMADISVVGSAIHTSVRSSHVDLSDQLPKTASAAHRTLVEGEEDSLGRVDDMEVEDDPPKLM